LDSADMTAAVPLSTGPWLIKATVTLILLSCVMWLFYSTASACGLQMPFFLETLLFRQILHSASVSFLHGVHWLVIFFPILSERKWMCE
jgi:hypothetical protein